MGLSCVSLGTLFRLYSCTAARAKLGDEIQPMIGFTEGCVSLKRGFSMFSYDGVSTVRFSHFDQLKTFDSEAEVRTLAA